MLRYDQSRQRPPNYLARSEQWRILRLVIALGLVVILMGQLRGPRAARILGLFFGEAGQMEHQPDEASALHRKSSPESRNSEKVRPDAAEVSDLDLDMGGVLALPPEDGHTARGDLSRPHVAGLEDVRDNGPFRQEDTRPWFELLGVLHGASQHDVQIHSIGKLTAVQLLEQPEAYRGRLITLEGTARQSLAFDPLRTEPTSADLAKLCLFPKLEFPALAARTYLTRAFLSNYHRVAIVQSGASVPIVVFALDVPADFPTGESLSEPVSVTGYFFKNWLYSSGDGVGVGPIILAKRIHWERRPSNGSAMPAADTEDVWIVVAAAAVFAALATWWLWRRSRSVVAVPSMKASTLPDTPDFSFIRSSPSHGSPFGEPS